MEAEKTIAEQEAQREQEQLSRQGMFLLTGGLTDQGEVFLIAVGASMLAGVLYPLIGGWAFLAFPIVFIGAVLGRSWARSRNRS